MVTDSLMNDYNCISANNKHIMVMIIHTLPVILLSGRVTDLLMGSKVFPSRFGMSCLYNDNFMI